MRLKTLIREYPADREFKKAYLQSKRWKEFSQDFFKEKLYQSRQMKKEIANSRLPVAMPKPLPNKIIEHVNGKPNQMFFVKKKKALTAVDYVKRNILDFDEKEQLRLKNQKNESIVTREKASSVGRQVSQFDGISENPQDRTLKLRERREVGSASRWIKPQDKSLDRLKRIKSLSRSKVRIVVK